MRKRLLAFFMALAMVLTLIPVIAASAEDEEPEVFPPYPAQGYPDYIELFFGIEGQEYILVPSGEKPSEEDWLDAKTVDYEQEQYGIVFDNLPTLTEFDLYTRIAATETEPASDPVYMPVSTVCFPEFNDLSNGLTFTVGAVEGYEYIILEDGTELTAEKWNDAVLPSYSENNELYYVSFSGLKEAMTYVIYCRDKQFKDDVITYRFSFPVYYYEHKGYPMPGSEFRIVFIDSNVYNLVSFKWYEVERTYNDESEDSYYDEFIEIPDETGPSYLVKDTDIGKYLACKAFAGDNEVFEYKINEPVAYGTVYFETFGGTEISEQTGYSCGDKVTRPENDPVLDHFTFNGWYDEEVFDPETGDFTGFHYWDFDESTVRSSETYLYADWLRADNTTVLSLVSSEWNTVTVLGADDQEYIIVKKGTSIDGIEWDSSSYYVDGKYVIFDELDSDTDYEIYARFPGNDDYDAGEIKKVDAHTDNYGVFRFFSEGGSEVPDQIVHHYGDKLTKPTDPVKEGYMFLGWYQDEFNEETMEWDEIRWDFDKDTVKYNEEFLYARWGTLADVTDTENDPTDNNDYSATLADGQDMISLLGLTDDELAAGVTYWIDVQDSSKTVSDADKKLIEKALDGNTVALYLDINLFKDVQYVGIEQITETNGKVKISITVPKELREEGRTFAIVRTHEGKATLLNGTYDAKTGVFTFESDEFSTYALVYKDKVEEPVTDTTSEKEDIAKADAPNTLDNNATILSLMFVMMTVGVASTIVIDDKRRQLSR